MEILPQLLIFAIIASAIYTLVSAGLTLTFGVLEFINFAHGEVAMLGSYTFFWLYIMLDMGIAPAFLLTTLIIAIFGMLMEVTTFKPVRDRHEFIPLVLSIGVSILIQSFVIFTFGGNSKNYSKGENATVYQLFDGAASITLSQIWIIVSSIILITTLGIFLKYSKTGKAIRAVADDKKVAAIMGINVDRTMTILFAIGSMLAGIAGLLLAFDQNLNPKMGLMLSLKGFAAIIIGGVGSFRGAIIGAIIIGFSETLIVGLTSINAGFKDTIIFVILVAVLLWRPYGIFNPNKEQFESR